MTSDIPGLQVNFTGIPGVDEFDKKWAYLPRRFSEMVKESRLNSNKKPAISNLNTNKFYHKKENIT
jgi:hypothetical protein